MTDLNTLKTYGVVACLYAAAHGCHPRDVYPEDDGMQEVAEILAVSQQYDLGTLAELLGITPDPEMTGEHIGNAITALRHEVYVARNAALSAGHRAVGGTVHHIDGDPGNSNPANLVLVDPLHVHSPGQR